MPTLVNGGMQFTLAEAIKPEQLKGYGAVLMSTTDETVTLQFPTMHHAASWASTFNLEAQTWPGNTTVLSFADAVVVDVMHPDA